jgi:DNA-binding CsgD family transcriptional regulator
MNDMIGAIIGRDAEFDFVEAFFDDVGGGPAGLVLSGEPGIGKTVLWQAGVEEARGRFERVLTCRGVKTEAMLSFAGLSDLLGEVVVEAAPSLVAPRRRALEVALLLAEPGRGPLDPLAIGLAVYDVLRALAEHGPMLVAVDDVQWLDPASAGALEVALRRLLGEPIGVFATTRRAPGASIALGLERSLPEERLTVLSVGPLSLGALHHLLSGRLGLELTRPELARVQETSGGNPFFALELGRDLVRRRARPAAGQSLRVPESLRELIGGRLAQLPVETADVLVHVAALARPTMELVAAAHGDVERVREAISAAVADEIVELDDSRVRFAHPLLASICYERAPVWKRHAVHGALAAVVNDSEERARHLALSVEGPDAAVAVELDAGAEQAAARGATAAAAELCEMAVGLTPDDPPSSRRRRLRAARYHRLAGDGSRAVALLEELLPEVTAGLERADVLFERSSTLRGDAPRRKELFGEALVQAEGDDARSARILALQAGIYLWDVDGRAALAAARAAVEKAERSGDPALVAAVSARLGTVEGYACEVTSGLLERATEIEESLELELEYNESPRYALARQLMRVGEIELPRRMLEQLEASAAARGDEHTRVMVRWPLSMLEWLAGRWPLALEHASAAYELGEQAQHAHARVWIGRMKALIEADLGLEEQARASAEEGLGFARADANEFARITALGVLGRLELALGDIEAAAGYLRDVPGRLLAGGINDPTMPVWADAIETLVAAGELERARAYLEPYEAHSKRLGGPLALAGVARCRGLLAAAAGEQDVALATFEHALAQLSAIPYPLERGRTLLGAGIVRRQALQKKASRDALEQALVIFAELGARLWAEKTRAELARISGRRASGDELTETERRVATMAGAGLTNKQIASALFMGVSTVEAHLSHVYLKLGIRSRAGLGARLATAVDAGANPVAGPAQS